MAPLAKAKRIPQSGGVGGFPVLFTSRSSALRSPSPYLLRKMHAYTSLDQVKGKLPLDFIIEALDDDGDGEIDVAAWQMVSGNAAIEIDGYLAMKYLTPFPEPFPSIVQSASLIFVMESLHDRRGKNGEDGNPYAKRATEWRNMLAMIGNGEKPLTPLHEKATPSVRVVTEPARTSSASGHLSS